MTDETKQPDGEPTADEALSSATTAVEEAPAETAAPADEPTTDEAVTEAPAPEAPADEPAAQTAHV